MAERLPSDFEFEDLSRRGHKSRDAEFRKYLDGGIYKIDVRLDHGFTAEDKNVAENNFLAAVRNWLKTQKLDYRVKHGRWQGKPGTVVMQLVKFERPVDEKAGESNGQENHAGEPAAD